jgi:hypothetical protein
VHTKTADALWNGAGQRSAKSLFISFGMVANLRAARTAGAVPLALFLFEPPTVAPRRFLLLPAYARLVENVFTLLAPGECWGPLALRARQFRYPQPAIDAVTDNPSRNGWLVAIWSAKEAHGRPRELYSERRKAIEHFGLSGSLDLFGIGWERVKAPAGRHPGLTRAWRGPIEDKLQTLLRYKFALCYENSRWRGYVTEKIFDCLRAGTIPVYWGAPDIREIVPPSTFIDRTAFASNEELARHLDSLSEAELNEFRAAGAAFLQSDAYFQFSSQAFARLVLDLLPE